MSFYAAASFFIGVRRSAMGRGLVSTGALVAAVAITGACRLEGLSFIQDDRVTIVTPDDRSTVSLPVTIDWTSRDFAGRFGVFVDTDPMPPTEDLAYLAKDDETCRPEDGCPDQKWLRQHDVFVTEETEITLRTLRDFRERAEDEDPHRAVIVLLDDEGNRLGESTFSVDFFVERSGEP